MTVQVFADGAVIFWEGADTGPAYIVDEGLVRLTKATLDGDTVLGEVGVGGIFGEVALIDDAPRMATARAVGQTVCTQTDELGMHRKLALIGPATLGFYREMIAYIRETLPYDARRHTIDGLRETSADRAARQMLARLPEFLSTLQHPPPAIITVFRMFREYIENRLPPY